MEVDEEPEQGGMEQVSSRDVPDVEGDENEYEDYGYNHESESASEGRELEKVQNGEKDSEEEDGEQGELEELGFAEL